MTGSETVSPQIAVVTAAHDMENYVGATIASVLEQTLSNFEMIVVDDGSRDATARIVAAVEDTRVRLISTPNSGPGAARNRGLAACRAPLVLFLDADDLLLPDALEQMVATMAASPASSPSQPACRYKSHRQPAAVAAIGMARNRCSRAIHAPGCGRRRLSAGTKAMSRNGSASPRPRAANTATEP